MDEIRCPMCGKPNPRHLDVCQYCEARLKPLILDSTPEEPDQPAGTPPSGAPPSGAPPGSGRELPEDWLSNLRQEDEPEAEGPPAREPAAGEESPEWLSRIRGQSERASPPEPEPEPEEEPGQPPSDWLSRMRSSAEEERPEDEYEDEGLEGAAEDDLLDDRLAGFGVPEERPRPAETPVESEWLPAEEPEQDVPEWLRGLRPETPAEAPAEPEEAPDIEIPAEGLETKDIPGLSFRDLTEPEETAETPEWLRGLRPETPAEAPAEPEEAPDIEIPAEGLETKDIPGLSFRDRKGPPEPAEPADTPEWLKGLRPERPVEPGQPPEEEPDLEIPAEGLETKDIPGLSFRDQQEITRPGDVPEWLRGLEPEEAPEAAAGDISDEEIPPEALETREVPGLSFRDRVEEDEEEAPEWLRGLRPPSEEAPAELPAVEPTIEPTAPETPAMEEPVEEIPDEPAEELPDWLQQPAFDEPAQELFEETLEGLEAPDLSFEEEEPELEEELPDWLTQADMPEEGALEAAFEELDDAPFPPIEEEAPSSIEESFFDEEPLEEELFDEPAESGLPDWIADDVAFEDIPSEALETREVPGLSFRDEGERAEDEAFEPGEVPDWLEELGPEDIALPEAAEPAEAPEAEDEAALPEWMEGETERESPVSLEEGDMPDWLRGLQAFQEEGIAEGEEPVFTDLEEPLAPVDAEQAEELPEWLAELRAKTSGVPAEAEVLGEPPEAEPAQEFQEEAPEIEEDLAPIRPGDLPEWISEMAPGEAIESAPLESVEEDIDLAPAELPGWLKAMRPVEAVAPVAPPGEGAGVEGVGPLAGLQGILPAEPEITQAGTPPTFSLRVEVSQRQHEHINLLQELIGNEAEVQPRRIRRVGLIAQHVARWVIAALLLATVLIPAMAGLQTTPLPELVPEETLAVGEIISGLPQGAPVLVAFDYEPGTSAELNASAAAVIDHLMLRGSPLTLVSTSPTGPALAERFIADPAGVGGHNYVNGQQYVNLGYIPGGAVGLLEFSTSPKGLFPLPFNLQGLEAPENVWASPPLQSIGGLADFGLVMVIVDDPGVARAWIEQVEPRLGDTPLVMVTSAQITPLVRPYYQSGSGGQVEGLVSGLTGGVAYERITGRSLQARTYWDAFSNGLMMAEVLIVAGAILSLGLLLFAQRQPESAEETA